MKEKEASIPKHTGDFGCQHSRSTTYDEINWDPNRQLVIWSDSLRPEHANQTRCFMKSLWFLDLPKKKNLPMKKSPKKLPHPYRSILHIIKTSWTVRWLKHVGVRRRFKTWKPTKWCKISCVQGTNGQAFEEMSWIMQKGKRDHLRPRLDAIVKRKNQGAADRSATITVPHIMHNIANTPRPDKAKVTARHTSSFPASWHNHNAFEHCFSLRIFSEKK